jgi:hypothetical protein
LIEVTLAAKDVIARSESDEAIQNLLAVQLDCFASLAMTAEWSRGRSWRPSTRVADEGVL